jgi:uncharacterized protein (DUF2141 family)
MMTTRSLRRAALALALLATPAIPARAADLGAPAGNVVHVDVVGLRNSTGQVLCALFATSDGFPTEPEKALMRSTAPIANQRASCEFQGVAPAIYAIAVVHDENSNGKLDRNFVGMPKEGVGASEKPKPHFGPPSFDAAKFSYSGGRLDLAISINYLL